MAIGPTFEKGEPTEADLEHAYNKAREIGLFLVEKYARALLREQPRLEEFIMNMGRFSFATVDGRVASANEQSNLARFVNEWDDTLKLTGEPMRFTAYGPVRREG
jgi:hypothetical protein